MLRPAKHKLRVGDTEHDLETLPNSRPGFVRSKFDGINYEVFFTEEVARDRLVLIDGQPFKTRVESGRRGSHLLLVEGEQIEVSLQKPRIEAYPSIDTAVSLVPRPRATLERETKVRAHMPGRIAGIKTNRSARVKTGDPLFILVAMKMENTIVAPVGGVVKDVQVELGASVNKGDVLATIEEL